MEKNNSPFINRRKSFKRFFVLLKSELLSDNTNTELSNKLRFLRHFSEETDDYPKFNCKTIDFKAECIELKTDLSWFFSFCTIYRLHVILSDMTQRRRRKINIIKIPL